MRRFLEVSALICNGHVGSDDERSKIDPHKGGILWYYKEEDQKRFHLSNQNNHWFNIIEQTETYMIGRFSLRYDGSAERPFPKSKALTSVFVEFFDFIEEIIEEKV